jgi:hypothetical protein
MTRRDLMMVVLLIANVWTTAVSAQEFDFGRAKTLTAEQAASLKLRGESLRFDKLTELTPEVAAALAKHKIELQFGSLASVSAETIKAFAGHNAGLSFPKIVALSPDQARILAGYEGSRLSLNGLPTVSPEVAKALADYKGELHLNGAKELSADAAAALAGRKGAIHLGGLTSLTSIPLAQKLGGQNFMNLNALATVSDDVGRALFMSPDAKNIELYLGLKELSLGTAKAMGERGRTVGAHFHMNELESIPDEIAEALSCRAAIRCTKVTKLSDRAAKALNQFNHSHMYALSDVSNEALEMFSKRGGFMIHGLKKLDCVPFASTLMSNNSSFLDLNQLETISDEAADALAMDSRRSKRGVIPLPSLKSLNSVALAEVLAERKGNLALSKLDAAPDAVVRALAAHQGPLSLGLKSLSVEAAKAVAQRQDDTTLGATKLSDEATKELAQAKGKISLANLTEISDASLAALRANPKILLPKSIK